MLVSIIKLGTLLLQLVDGFFHGKLSLDPCIVFISLLLEEVLILCELLVSALQDVDAVLKLAFSFSGVIFGLLNQGRRFLMLILGFLELMLDLVHLLQLLSQCFLLLRQLIIGST